MKNETNEKLDALVLKVIKGGERRASKIASKVAAEGTLRAEIDRSLQRLRKAGRIRFNGSSEGWSAVAG